MNGAGCSCDRCKRPLRLAPTRNKNPQFRRAKVPNGACPDCVMTQFLYNTYPINMQIDEAGPELLLKPGIREAFLACGLMEGCDMSVDEVDWQRVVNNWRLPVAINKKDPKNPYRMGQAKERPLGKGSPFRGSGSGSLVATRGQGGELLINGQRPTDDDKPLAEAVEQLLKGLAQ